MIFFDCEADNLLRDATQLWCLVAYEKESDKYLIYHVATEEEVCYPKNSIIYTNIYKLLVYITNNTLVGHNSISYDLPLLRKLYQYEYNLKNQVDTLLLSRLYYPDRAGHGLGWYGNLLGFPKGNHEDFTHFSNQMLQYCINDVNLLVKVYDYLAEEAKDWDWSESIKLEYKVADIQMRQELKGVLFDVPKAIALSATIEAELTTLEHTILKGILPKAVKVGETVTKPFKKNGDLTEVMKKWISGGNLIGCPGNP